MRVATLLPLLLLAPGCLDAVPEVFCDERRPCATGFRCVSGHCFPGTTGNPGDGGPLVCASGCDGGTTCVDGGCRPTQTLDGGRCEPGNCRGCCRTGVCLDAGTTSCGVNGGACQSCLGSQTCNSNGVCQSPACAGCVDTNGLCRPGNSTLACGAGGLTCASCAAGQSCLFGACAGATCGPQSCAFGCCNGAGVCVGGGDTDSCGFGGNACVSCGPAEKCVNQGCTSSTCAGCISSNGRCEMGNANFACGLNGGPCEACSANQTCLSGKCQGGCGPGTCAGCCAGNTCIPFSQQSSRACGFSGDQCGTCGNLQQCAMGVCIPTPGCGPGTANPCTTGCCSGSGANAICLLGTASNNCGNNGAQCQVCNTQLGQACVNRACINVFDAGTRVIAGAPCIDAQQCPGLNFCIPESGFAGPTGWVGGYCSAPCGSAGQAACGPGGACARDEQSGIGLCRSTCTQPGLGQSSCRQGYVCARYGLSDGGLAFDGTCVPNCLNPGYTCPANRTCVGGYCL